VSNPRRFALLHEVAAELLNRLVREFDVERVEAYGIDAALEHGYALSLPTVMLRPVDNAAAPLCVAFTGFPGLRVRFGRWCAMAFPTCGCDACNETASDEADRLKRLIDNLVHGRLVESVRVEDTQAVWVEWVSWSASERMESRTQLDREHVQPLLAGRDYSSLAWAPWPRRGSFNGE
jgi:hypothetical protein